MAETLLVGVTHLVAQISVGTETWTNGIYIKATDDTHLSDSDSPVGAFHDFMVSNTSNDGFVESITGYAVYQRKEGEVNVEHPPIFQNNYHTSGARNAAYGGSGPHGDPLPKDVVIYVKLGTSGGRSGKMFIRNNLWEAEVISLQGGVWQFHPEDDRFTQARFITTVDDNLAPFMTGGSAIADHQWVVPHLLFVKEVDTRAAYTSVVASAAAIRPTWNRAHR